MRSTSQRWPLRSASASRHVFQSSKFISGIVLNIALGPLGSSSRYAKVGRLRSEAETMSFVDLSRFLNDQLQSPMVRSDPRLRLWCLAAKGYTDIEID
jgi:hypothetical protein